MYTVEFSQHSMENCTNDSTVDVNATTASSAFEKVPFLVYNLLMVFGVLVPVTVGDALVLIALGKNKNIPVQIRETLLDLRYSRQCSRDSRRRCHWPPLLPSNLESGA